MVGDKVILYPVNSRPLPLGREYWRFGRLSIMAAQLKSPFDESSFDVRCQFEDQDFLRDFFSHWSLFFYTDARAHAYYMCLV